MKLRIVARAVMMLGLLGALASTALAQTIRLAFHDTTVVGGTAVDIPIYADSSLTGKGVVSYQLEFTYNNSALNFVGVTSTATATAGWGAPLASEISPGRIRIVAAGAAPASGTGKFVIAQFTTKIYTYGTYAGFYFQSAMLNEGTPGVVTRNGTLTITPPTTISVSPNTALLSRGETQQFSVYGGKSPYTWTTTNPSVASINASGLLTGLAVGTTAVVCTDTSGVVDTTGTVEVRGMRLSFPDTSRYQGQMLDLPVRVTSVSGLGVVSGQLTIGYSPTLWTPQEIVVAGSLCAGVQTVAMNTSGNQLMVSFSGAAPLSGSGVLLYVRMKASTTSSGGSGFSFQNALFNESLLATSNSATVSVLPLQALTITPGGSQTLMAHDSLQFSVSGGIGPYIWSLSDSSRASVSSSGMLTALRGGQIVVSARDALGGTGSSGTISLYDFRLTVPDTTVLPTATVEIPLWVSHTDTAFTSFQLTAAYSTSPYVQFVGLNTTGTLTNGWSVTVSPPPYPGGVVQIAGAGVTPVTAAGALVKLVFSVNDSIVRPATIYVNLSNVTFNEGAPRPLVNQGYFQLNDIPVLHLQPTALNFTEPGTGVRDSAAIAVWNSGTGTLNVFISLNGSSTFSVSQTSLTLLPGDSVSYRVYYQPDDAQPDSATLIFSTNDSYHPTVHVPLMGAVVTADVPPAGSRPTDFSLMPNYPNPFNPSTSISFSLPERSVVVLRIVDVLGREIETLMQREAAPGTHVVRWNADQYPSGVYIARLEARATSSSHRSFIGIQKMILLK